MLDGDELWFVRQPREAVGIPDLLEIVAGKLDVEGRTRSRPPGGSSRRRSASRPPTGSRSARSSPRPVFTNEEIHLFLARGISDVAERPEVEEDERIDVEIRPLSALDEILATNKDSKTLIALYRFREQLGAH